VKGTSHVWRWDWKDGRVGEWGAYRGDKATVPVVAFAANGRRFVAAIGPFVVGWKVKDRRAGTGEILKGHGGPVKALAWAPGSKRVTSGGDSKNIVVWGFGWFGASQKLKFRSHVDMVNGLSFSPDGSRLAAAGAKSIVVWDARDPRRDTSITLDGHTETVRYVQYLPDSTLISIDQVGHVVLWDVPACLSLTEFQLSDRMPTAVAVSADGKRIATGSPEGRVAIFETARVASAVTVGV